MRPQQKKPQQCHCRWAITPLNQANRDNVLLILPSEGGFPNHSPIPQTTALSTQPKGQTESQGPGRQPWLLYSPEDMASMEKIDNEKHNQYI